MGPDEAIDLVNRALSREYNSLEGYILGSSPWVEPSEMAALDVLKEIAAAHAQTAAWMTERLREDFGAGPTVKAFEYWRLDLNYLSIPFLLGFAVEHNRRVVAEYDAVLKRVAGHPALTAIFQRVRDEAKSHLAKLERLTAPPAAPAAAKPAAPAAAPPAAARPTPPVPGAAAKPAAAPPAAARPTPPAPGAAAKPAAAPPAPPPPPPPAS